jgi:hypothetical protein
LMQPEHGLSREHFTFRCWQRTHACALVGLPGAEAGGVEDFMNGTFSRIV